MANENSHGSQEFRKKRRAINEVGHAHFLTFSCWQRRPLLNRDRSRMWMVDSLNRVRQNLNVSIWAYVIMPEHVHLLLFPREPGIGISRILAALKAPVSRAAKNYLQETGQQEWLNRLTTKKGSGETFRFWQPGGGYDHNLWNSRPIEEVINYIHANPVRRGLVERPTDWDWSSARCHAGESETLLTTDQVMIE